MEVPFLAFNRPSYPLEKILSPADIFALHTSRIFASAIYCWVKVSAVLLHADFFCQLQGRTSNLFGLSKNFREMFFWGSWTRHNTSMMITEGILLLFTSTPTSHLSCTVQWIVLFKSARNFRVKEVSDYDFA